jgi:hypothetical protein
MFLLMLITSIRRYDIDNYYNLLVSASQFSCICGALFVWLIWKLHPPRIFFVTACNSMGKRKVAYLGEGVASNVAKGAGQAKRLRAREDGTAWAMVSSTATYCPNSQSTRKRPLVASLSLFSVGHAYTS